MTCTGLSPRGAQSPWFLTGVPTTSGCSAPAAAVEGPACKGLSTKDTRTNL